MMNSPQASRTLRRRLSNRLRRYAIERFARRPFHLNADVPYISFTFDDFPRSALTEGGGILANRGVRGTYFVSLGLLGSMSPSGPIASSQDLNALLQQGHDLGCHTFDHLDGTKSTAGNFERSIEANRAALGGYGVEADFAVFAYPLDGPALAIKRVVGQHFVACRGGGQTTNQDTIDLNLLKAYFLDKRTRGNLDAIARVIELNAAARGWLIFATHDIAPGPSDYGCTPDVFEHVVQWSLQSGARVLPMTVVCRELGIAQ